MTIDEAIAHAREVAKESRENIITGSNLEPYESDCNVKCEQCAEEHEQLAEWLEELKFLKSEPIDCGSDVGKAYIYNLGRENGYSKAIDDFANSISEYLGVENATKYGNKDADQQANSYSTIMKYEIADAIEDVADRLKGGGVNE